MPVVPKTRIGKLQYYEAHLQPWAASAAQIGLSPGSVAALADKAEAARAAYLRHVAARSAAASATRDYYQKIRALHNGPGAGADMIRQIRTTAQVTDDPQVYVLAMIPAPAAPSTLGPPGTPHDFGAKLNPGDGSLKLTWKCKHPAGSSGTIYQLSRRIGDSGPFVPLATLGKRTFTDRTVPAGAAAVTYQILALRSTAVGVAAQFTVNLGASGASAEAIKLAA
jgi:hypothetical protein